MKNQMKGKNGITLIALVITIIVLLILAGVTIATLTGDNGLLQKATNAKETSTDAEICEKIKLAYADYQTVQYQNNDYTYNKALESIFGQGNIENLSEKKDNYIIKIKNSNKQYYYNKDTGESGEYTYVDPFNYGTKTRDEVSTGDVITISKAGVTESFTVISNKDNKITAIPHYNITLTTNHPIQSPTAENITFSTKRYWTEIEGWNSSDKVIDESVNVDMNIKNDDETFKNNIQQYINAYKETLIDMGLEDIVVRACTKSELDSGLPSTLTDAQKDNIRNLKHSANFWLGSIYSNNGNEVWFVASRGNLDHYDYRYGSFGVRPIIEI